MTEENTSLQRSGGSALAVPDHIKPGAREGLEAVTIKHIRPPSLKLAQGQSKEIKRSNPEKFIEGLREGEMFNTLTRRNYGEGPLRTVFVRFLGTKNIQYRPMKDGGGVIDFDVPDGDPRTKFTTAEVDGKNVRQKPLATTYYDFLILVCHEDGSREFMSMSFKDTQIRKAQDLITQLNEGGFNIYDRAWSVRPVAEKRNNFDFYGWRVDPAGWVTVEEQTAAAALCAATKGKTVEVERGDDEEVDAAKDEHIPF